MKVNGVQNKFCLRTI